MRSADADSAQSDPRGTESRVHGRAPVAAEQGRRQHSEDSPRARRSYTTSTTARGTGVNHTDAALAAFDGYRVTPNYGMLIG